MEVIPAIDIAGGRVVRLRRGDFGDVSDFGGEPAELCLRYAADGASWIHLVDLDAARSGERSEAHAAILADIAARCEARLQVGGGLRSAELVEGALAAGVERAVVGTLAVRDPAAFGGLVERHGGRICLAADSLAGSTRIAGWLEDSGRPTVELVRRATADGVSAFLVTAIDRDGMLAGPDLALMRDVRAATDATVIASGGIGALDDLRALAGIGCDAVVVGRALLDGAFTLAEARAAAA